MNLTLAHPGRWLAATAAALAVAGVAAPAASAATPPTLPTGFAPVVDDTGTIAVAIPATWTDVDTAPVADDAGAPVPHIAAAPDVQSFTDSFDTPGVRFLAFPFTATPQSLIDRYGLTAGCADIAVQPYSDPVFTGLVQVGTSCGGGAATWNMVVASPADSSHTVVVQVQTATAADQQAFDTVLATFNFAGGAAVPTSAPVPTAAVPTVAVPTVAVPTVAASTVTPTPTVAVPTVAVPTVAVPTVAVPTVPTVPTPTVATPTVAVAPPTVAGVTTVAPQGIALTDDTGLLTVEVPTTWTYHETAPSDVGQAIIYASTDGQAAEGTVPSLIYIGGDYIADTAAVLGGMGALAEGCSTNPVEPYDDNVFVGHMQVFTACNGTETMKVIIVANPPSQSATVTLIVTMPTYDEAAMTLILETFDVTR